jgi:hypothetical protein
MTTFKVGDKAIQLQKSKYNGGTIGQVVVIEEVDFPSYEGAHPVVARALDGTGVGMMFRPSDLEKIEELPNVSNLSDHQLAKTFESAVRELENRAYLAGYNRGKEDAEAERGNEVEAAEPWVEEFENWNTPTAVEPVFDGWFDEPATAKVEPRVATEQDIRDMAIEQAKKDVEELQRTPNIEVINSRGRRESFYPEGAGSCDKVEFVVNREKRTVVALLKYMHENKAWANGVAKCDPTDTFNEHIGKAIALRRALGLEIPDEYIYAPQPTEVRVGNVFEWVSTYSGRHVGTVAEMVPHLDGHGHGQAFHHTHDGGWLGKDQVTIIDDSVSVVAN